MCVTSSIPGFTFVKLDDLKPGDVLVADGGFTCLTQGARVTVQEHDGDLYVPCQDGLHNLVGQLDDDNQTVIGLARA